MINSLLFRGNRKGVLVIGDYLQSVRSESGSPVAALDPEHPVYNSLIIPIKYYLNNYLNSLGHCLPLEDYNNDYFYYINLIRNPKTRSKPDLAGIKKEITRPEHKIILSIGSFTFRTVEKILNPSGEIQSAYTIKDLGRIFSKRLDDSELPIHLPVLHNIANLKFELTKDFIDDFYTDYISYFQYTGVKLGEFLMKHKEGFEFITPMNPR